jgi:cytochrome c oxidase subunit 2
VTAPPGPPSAAGRRRARTAAAALAGLALTGCGGGPSMLDPAGPDAARIAGLWWLVLALGTGVYVTVLVLLGLATLRARRADHSPERLRDEAGDRRVGRRFVVLGGIVGPGSVLLVLLLVSSPIGAEVASRPASVGVRVEVTGHRFWWEVAYPDAGFVTANEIHVPVGEPVEVSLTSTDVIHSFWVPQLHGKVDLTPGHQTSLTFQADQPGTYRGECAEFCGIAHARMHFLVIAEPRDRFDAWLAGQQEPAAPPAGGRAERGEEVFLSSACAACHTVRGTPATGEVGPDLTHLASRRTIAAGTLPNTRGHLGGWILDPQSLKPGHAMPPTNLTGEELQVLLGYLETLE